MVISKKTLPLLMFAGLIVGLAGCKSGKSGPNPSPTPVAIKEPVNVIDVKDRPYISITPRTDGKEVKIIVNDLKKPATAMKYHLEFQAGTLIDVAEGGFDFNAEKPPTSKDALLGSCSAGGKCSFHENIVGGDLTMSFTGNESYSLKDEWHLHETKKAVGDYSSRDGKLQIKAGKFFDPAGFVIISQTSGLPTPIEGTLLSGPYGVYPAKALTAKPSLEITMRLSEEAATAKIYGFDGSKWVALTTKVDGKTATASKAAFYPVYVAVGQ